MIDVYEKRGQWKVSGSAVKYATKEEALLAAVETPDLDPLEELRKNGSIQEGFDNDEIDEEQGLSESPDRGIFTAPWD